jgi:hypothetical protein
VNGQMDGMCGGVANSGMKAPRCEERLLEARTTLYIHTCGQAVQKHLNYSR